MRMVKGNGGNQFRQYAGNSAGYNDVIGNQEKGCCLSSDIVIDCSEERGRNLTSSRRTDSAPVYDLDGSAEEAAKLVGDIKSLANEADASFAKHKALEMEIKRLLKAVASQDIMIFVQNESVVDTSNLQTELERTKERFKNCIIKKETEYAKLWND
nr:hypothetical protein [Tanacetum cinerariifolium]